MALPGADRPGRAAPRVVCAARKSGDGGDSGSCCRRLERGVGRRACQRAGPARNWPGTGGEAWALNGLYSFAIYCGWILAEYRGDGYCLAPVIPEIKMQLLSLQRRIVAMPDGMTSRRAGGSGDRPLRRRTGDWPDATAVADSSHRNGWWQSAAGDRRRPPLARLEPCGYREPFVL